MSMSGRGMSGGGKLGLALLGGAALAMVVASDDFQDAVSRVTGEPTVLKLDSGSHTFDGVGNTILDGIFDR